MTAVAAHYRMHAVSVFSHSEADWSPAEVQRRLQGGEIELIDVREPYEREAGYIPGSRHIELERLASNAEAIPRDRPVVFQCRLGARSGMAARAFRAAGWDARNLAGGIQAWVDAGLPIAPEGGRVAEH
jgi:rhodanese-related sulfurtransferase